MKQQKAFTHQDKQKIKNKINKIKKLGTKNDCIHIGKLVIESIGIDLITEKNNGIWFDLNSVDNDTLYKIEKYAKKILNKYTIETETFDYIPYCVDLYNINNRVGPKFSKKEKNLINRFRNETETETEYVNTEKQISA